MILRSALETPRLRVRPFEPDDAEQLVALFADPRVARFVGDGLPLSPDQAQAWVRTSAANLERFGYGTGAVVDKAGGPLIGWAGLARPPQDAEEIIYGLEAARWGQGYGRELLEALVRFAADRGLEPVRATVDRLNAASVHLLVSNGFRRAIRDYGEAGTDLYLRP